MIKAAPPSRIALSMPRLSRYGGAEGFGWRLAEALASCGHAVDFLCARAEGRLPEGVTPVVLGRPPLSRAVKNLWFAWAVERHLGRTPYEVVIGLSRTWNQDILRVGGGPQEIFNRLTLPAHGQGLARTMKALRRALSPSGAVIRWMEARQFDSPMNPAQRVVCVSDLVRGWLLEAHPALAPAAVEVVYNRPDLSRFVPPDAERRERLRAAQGWADRDVVVCTAGTNFALKGVGTLIRALHLLPENYRLAVAGGRRPDAWAALAQRLGLEGRVRFAGKVDDMPAFYAAADVFALPTYYDACSNAVLEALACGLPAISSARNGSAVFADPRLVLHDPGDHEALARLILLAAQEAPAQPFQWPDDRPCGLLPYIRMVDEIIRTKRGLP